MMKGKIIVALLIVGLCGPAARPAQGDEHGDKIAELFDSSFAQETAGNIDRALSDVLAVISLDPLHYIAAYRAAWLHYLKANYDESARLYDKASSLAPGALEPRLGMMLPLMAAQKWSQAEALGKELVSHAPDNYLAGSRLAFALFSEGKYAEAEKQYKAVLKNYPSELEMALGLGWTYVKQGRKAEAREMFEKVLAVRKQNASALAGLGAL